MRHTAHRSIGRIRAVVPARAHASVGDPEIISLDVSEGSFLGGTTVIITGTDFNNVSSVTFNGVAATINSSTATSINVTTAASADNVGLGNIVVTTPVGTDTLTNGWTYSVLLGATEYWLASQYDGSGSWEGLKDVADLALPGGSANPTFCGHSTSLNPFGAGVDYVALPGTASNIVTGGAATYGGADYTVFAKCSGTWGTTDTFMISGGVGVYRREFAILGTTAYARVDGAGGSYGSWTHGITGTGFRWLRYEWDQAGNNGYLYSSTDNVVSPLDVTTWTSRGQTPAGLTTSPTNTGDTITLGAAFGLSQNYANGSLARAMVYLGRHSTGGLSTLLADFHPDAGTVNSVATQLTGTGDGRTWTIGRSTSGRRSAWVDRDAFWFGTDDYLSTPDNASFDFGASQDFTVAALFRSIQDADSNNKALISKRDFGSGTAGWYSYVAGSGTTAEFAGLLEVADTSTVISDATWNNPGQLQTHILTRTAGATGTLDLYTDATSVGGAAAVPGDTSNALAVSVARILNSGSGALFFEGLIYGLGISRTGLTQAQVTYLDTELRADS